MTQRPTTAAPAYRIGQEVNYTDHHSREQRGQVTRIEASWNSYSPAPLIIYSVTHPSYRNKRMHASEARIHGAPRKAP